MDERRVAMTEPTVEEAIHEFLLMPILSSKVRQDRVGDCVLHLPKRYRKAPERATSKDFSDVREDEIRASVCVKSIKSEIHRLARKDKDFRRIIHKI